MSKIGILEKLRNMRFVEENCEEINKDKFFKTDYGFEEIYYNPNSTAGGQLVYNQYTFDLISEASKEQLKNKSGEKIVDADVNKQMNKKNEK